MAALDTGSVGTVLVVGATGYLGSHVVRALNAVRQVHAGASGSVGGLQVFALVRESAERVSPELRPFIQKTIVGDATKPASLAGICDDVDYVVSCIGARSAKSSPTFWDVDFQGTMNVLNIAVEAGVKHFFYVSVLGGDVQGIREQVPMLEAKERVTDALKNLSRYGNIDLKFTVIRPGPFFNDIERLYDLGSAGKFYSPGDGEFDIAPIHGADLGQFITGLVVDVVEGKAVEKEVSVGGPETFSFNRLLELIHRIHTSGSGVLEKTKVPLGALRAAGKLSSLVNPNASAALLMIAAVTAANAGVGTSIGTLKIENHLREYRLGQASVSSPGFKEVSVHSGNFFTVDVVAKDAGTLRIVWAFKTRGKDVGFGIVFEGNPVVPIRRCDSHVEMQEGSLVCDAPGTYRLRWDNTYSHFNKKFLIYRLLTDDKVNDPPIGKVVTASQTTGVVLDDGDDNPNSNA